jgi:hypothetical protein
LVGKEIAESAGKVSAFFFAVNAVSGVFGESDEQPFFIHSTQ